MKHNWEFKRLDEVCKLSAGGDKPDETTKEKTITNVYPVYSNGMDRDGLYGYCSKSKVNNPALTISGRGTIGYPSIRREPFVPIIRLIVAEPMTVIKLEYLYYWVIHKKFSGNGAAIPQLTVPMIKDELIPVPPMEVQEQIVKELDKINEIISDCKEAIRNLDSLAQSLFYDYFGDPITNPKGWKVAKLKDVIIGKLTYGAGAAGVPFDGNVRYIRITDIDENGRLKPEIASSPSVYESKYDLQEGDILFARSGATVGKTYLYDSEIGKAIYAGYLIKATVNQNIILPLYLFALTKTLYYWDYIRQSINGVAQPNVNAQSYGALPIPIPLLELQEKFAERIEQIEQQKKGLEETIANMQTLLDSRMDYWFN